MPETEVPPAPEKLEPHRNGETHEATEALITARIGIWLFIGALTMMFGALALIWLLKYGDRLSYYFVAPKSLYGSTLALLLSSFTYARAVRAIRRDDQAGLSKWLGITVLLGCLFVIGQTYSWFQLVQAGVNAHTNVFSGLFYILTSVHAAHVLGGLGWVGYVYWQSRHGVYTARKSVGVELGGAYWHFMDAVWFVFFVLVMFL